MNLSTLIILAFVIALVVLVIKSIRNDKKKGKSLCGSGCANCPMSEKCHSQNE